MMTIDGSKGWGQVLRTSIALSALTLKPVRVVRIRESRPKPGLMPQHIAGIRTIAEFCDAEVKGLRYGSKEIEFIPRRRKFFDRVVDIGTSGSVSLLLQTLTPFLIFTDREVKIEIIGGTAGMGSPTIEYTKYVTFSLLEKMGVKVDIVIKRQGFYPRGGGKVEVIFHPTSELKGVKITERGRIEKLRGISICGSLPLSVAERQATAAKETLKDYGDVEIDVVSTKTLSKGTSITLWVETEKTILGSDGIGKKGVRAETIGRRAAEELVKTLNSGAALDKFMADQILVFMALAKGSSSVSVEKITKHCVTNIEVCEKILGCNFKIEKNLIEVEGVSFTP